MANQNIINIPDALYRELLTRQKESIFPTLDDLVAYILQDYLDKQKNKSGDKEDETQQVIEKRLKNLGYL